MVDAQQRCPICQKSKTRTKGGFVTQFLDCCNCDLASQDDQTASLKLCARCGKVDRSASGQDGSLTQWIFKSNRCDCPKAETNIAEAPEEEDVGHREEEVELELNPAKFPAERYKALKILGNGASGTVYLARDRVLGKKVAVKVLRDVSGPQLISFQDEARITSKLNHPNIIGILDFGPTSGGAPYMVLDYLANAITLQERTSRNESSLESTIELFIQLCDALEYAHNLGIFHRDLKPSNVLVFNTNDGEIAKIIDFGVGKVTDTAQQTTIYQGQTIVGTPAYMAPELLKEEQFDARSEVYSLGCVLFEAISGYPPFEGSSAFEVLGMHAHSEIPELPLDDSNRLKQKLQYAISPCLAKDRLSRPTMGTMKALLVQALSSRDHLDDLIPEVKSNRKRSSIMILIAGICLLLLMSPPFFLQKKPSKTFTLKQSPDVERLAEKELYTIFSVSRTFGWRARGMIEDRHLKWLARYRRNEIEMLELGTVETSGDHNITADGFIALSKLPLTKLGLEGVDIKPGYLKAIGKMPRLAELNLSHTSVRDLDIADLARSKIKVLHLDGTVISDMALEYLAKIRSLESLSVADTHITGKNLGLLTLPPGFRRLNVSGCQITDETTKAIRQIKTLQELSIGRTLLSYDGFATLAKTGSPDDFQLIDLTVAGNDRFDDRCLKLITTRWPYLVQLDIDSTKVTPQAIDMLKNLKRLEVLSLGDLGLKDSDTEPLTKLPRLVKLNLHGNPIGDATIERLSKGNNRLADLDVTDCNVTSKIIKLLKEHHIDYIGVYDKTNIVAPDNEWSKVILDSHNGSDNI